jgi:hypothetical protein
VPIQLSLKDEYIQTDLTTTANNTINGARGSAAFLEGNEARGSVVISPARAESALPCQLGWPARCSNMAQMKELSFKDGKNVGHVIRVRIGR